MNVNLFTFLPMHLPIPPMQISKYHPHKNASNSVKARIIADTFVHKSLNILKVAFDFGYLLYFYKKHRQCLLSQDYQANQIRIVSLNYFLKQKNPNTFLLTKFLELNLVNNHIVTNNQLNFKSYSCLFLNFSRPQYKPDSAYNHLNKSNDQRQL